MNTNNRNGKEVHKGQMPENIHKEGGARPENRRRKKNTPVAKDINPAESKKIPININKNTGDPSRSSNKGHVIKFENKDNRIYPVEAPSNEVRDSNSRSGSPSYNKNISYKESSEYKVTTDNKTDKENFKLSTNAGKWLLIAAAILFIAWAVMYFYYKIGGNSHMLLALAVICGIVSLVGRRNN